MYVKPSGLSALVSLPPCSILTSHLALPPVLQLDKKLFAVVSLIVLVLYLYRAHVLLIDFTKISVTLRSIYTNIHLLLSLSGVIKVIYSQTTIIRASVIRGTRLSAVFEAKN